MFKALIGFLAVVATVFFAGAAMAAPSISNMSPTSGPAGTTVTLQGTDLDQIFTAQVGPNGVSFDTKTPTQATFTVPANSSGIASCNLFNFTFTSEPFTGAGSEFCYTGDVTGLNPTSGTTAGGTPVTLSGSGFTEASVVKFGANSATGLTVVSDDEITVTSPAGTGTVNVTVTTPGGTSATSVANQFTYVAPPPPAPSVSSISPTGGPAAGSNTVTINGSNLTGATSVKFGTAEATDIVVVNSGKLTVTAPAGTGQVNITVTTPGGTSTTSGFTQYLYKPAPVITSIDPASGTTDDVIQVHGSGFSGTSDVLFGSTSVNNQFSVSSDTFMTVHVPAGTGTVDVRVVTGGGTSAITAADQFTYDVLPTVTGVDPHKGSTAGESSVGLTGTGFTGATAVKFGGVDATEFEVISDTEISAGVPAGAAGTVHVTVTTSEGTSTSSPANEYTYIAPGVISGVSPNSGPYSGGTAITIVGSGFTGVTAVKLSGLVATNVVVVDDNTITAVTPQGFYSVYVTIEKDGVGFPGSQASKFDYITPAPTVSEVTPNSGPEAGGTAVTVKGTNFVGTDFTGIAKLYFDGVAATDVVVVDSTTVTGKSPAGTGTVNVTVITPGGTSATSANNEFTYELPPAPTVTGVSPATGAAAGNTDVTITGTNFTGATDVKFGTASATDVVVVDANTITATSPAGTGPVDVTVTTRGGTSATSAADTFTFDPPVAPSVSLIDPSSGSSAGGTTVTVTGQGFTGATAVTFGTVAATSFNVIDDTSLTAVSPAGTGVVDVTVTTPVGTSTTGTNDLFSYVVPLPAVTGITPTSGSTAGGTTVIVSGTGFSGLTGVSFGATAAQSITLVNDTTLTAVSPAGTGVVDITVTTPAGTSPTGTNDEFTYVVPSPDAPTVSGIDPASGPTLGGTTVTITGTHLTGTTVVKFGTVSATDVTVVDDTTLTAISPAGTGIVDVTVTTPSGSSATSAADRFTYIVAPPVVSAIAPTSGPQAGGTAVTITGTGFSGATGVSFGGVAATGVVIVDDTKLTVISPAGTGIVDVVVTAASGSSAVSAADQFTYIAPAAPPPVVSGIDPASGAVTGGTSVTITGSGFTGATGVSFGGKPAASFAVNGDTVMTAVSPAGAGAVDITVTTPAGTSIVTAAARFTYTISIDSQNAQIIVLQLSSQVASQSASALATAGGNAVLLGLSGGNSLDVGSGSFSMSYVSPAEDPVGDAFDAIDGKAPATGPLSIWLDARGSGLLDPVATSRGWQVNVTGGVGYRIAPDVVVGVLAGYERFDYTSTAPVGELSGQGTTAGLYAGTGGNGLMTDLTIAFTGLGYDVVSGAASGSLDASRLLVSGGLSGLFDLAGFDVHPSARLYALWEGQGEWTDSLGAAHDEHDFLTARLSLGGTVSRALPIADGAQIVPSIGAYADYQLTSDSAGTTTRSIGGRVTAGVEIGTTGGAHVSVNGELSGLGTPLPAWTLRGSLGSSF